MILRIVHEGRIAMMAASILETEGTVHLKHRVSTINKQYLRHFTSFEYNDWDISSIHDTRELEYTAMVKPTSSSCPSYADTMRST